MSLGRGFPPPLGDTDGGTADGWMSDTGNGDAYVFARSGKMQRSPGANQMVESNSNVTEGASGVRFGLGSRQLFTPKANSSKTQGEQQDLQLSRTKAVEVKKKVDELYEFIKEKHNVHHKIRALVTGIKAGLLAVEREQQALWARAEKAEKELAMEKTTKDPRTGKRDRDTPSEEEVSKKQKGDETEETEGESSGWQTVKDKNEKKTEKEKKKEERKKEEKKKEEKKKEEKEKEEKNKEEKKTEEKKKSRQRSKGDALVLEVKKGTTYAELLRKVRADPELKELGENVVKTRRTQKGEMLFELKKDPEVKSSAFKQLVEKSLGEEANVRALSQETVVECRDLDEITTEDELRGALKVQCGLDVPMVIRMRKTYGGMQTAAIRISTLAAKKLLETATVRVGWSICPLRATPRVTKQMERCFKCMGFGHHARNCEGPDRSKLCRKCGEEGHIANDCAKPARCMLCKRQDENNHVTGGYRCPEYKKAMANQQ